LVLPCDLVCELGADKLLQAWMVKSATLEDLVGDSQSQGPRSGGLGVYYQTKTATPIKGEETDFVATIPLPATSVLPSKGSLFPDMAKVVYALPTDSLKDLMEEKKGFPVRHGLLRQHPRVKMLTTHRDAHIYIFPHWVMQFIKENERLETIGEDVIGWWVKAGWQKGLSTKLGLDSILQRPDSGSADGHASPGGHHPTSTRKLGVDSRATDAPNTVVSVKSSSNDDSNSNNSGDTPSREESEAPVPPMLAYIHPSTSTAPLIRRVDTAQLLLQISLQLAKLPSLEETGPDAPASPFAHARKVAYPEGVKSRTTITKQDSLVADNVTVQEKTSIKECVVGANCQIGEGAKLSQCLLMDGVVVGRNCKLTKCILGRRSELGEGCVLTECEVQENLLVEAKSEFTFSYLFFSRDYRVYDVRSKFANILVSHSRSKRRKVHVVLRARGNPARAGRV
jgi:translation initiation factor eIF-2B subunit gamma